MSKSIKDIEMLSDLMDQQFKVLGFRFGLDGLIGLIPVVGDVATSGVSFYIILRAFIMGFPLFVIMRMLVNILIDFVIGAVPVIGNVFDFIWKANTANVAIMKSYGENPVKTKRRSGAVLLSFVLGLFVLFSLMVFVLVKIISLVFSFIF